MYEGQTVTDNGITWKVKNLSKHNKLSSLLIGGGLPIGCIIPYSASETNPQGFLECNGAAISRDMYPELFQIIGTTYGDGDGSTTFNLPDLRGRFLEGSTTVGTVKEAGLPNIEAGFDALCVNNGNNSNSQSGSIFNVTGALSRTVESSATTACVSSTYTSNPVKLNFDASTYNSIYSDSVNTVQPPSLTVRYIIKAFDTVTVETGTVDYTKFAQDLANRLTRENTPAFNTKVTLETSGTYTVPYTGWYKITMQGGGGGGGGGSSSYYGIRGGGGGGQGGYYQFYKYLEKDIQLSYTIGAGGAGGTGRFDGTDGSNGGNTNITINGVIYSATGGQGGLSYEGAGYGGEPGVVKINNEVVLSIGGMRGIDGGSSSNTATNYHFATAGTGGGIVSYRGKASKGSGGYGGVCYQTVSNSAYTYKDGYPGGSGYIELEYFDPTL